MDDDWMVNLVEHIIECLSGWWLTYPHLSMDDMDGL